MTESDVIIFAVLGFFILLSAVAVFLIWRFHPFNRIRRIHNIPTTKTSEKYFYSQRLGSLLMVNYGYAGAGSLPGIDYHVRTDGLLLNMTLAEKLVSLRPDHRPVFIPWSACEYIHIPEKYLDCVFRLKNPKLTFVIPKTIAEYIVEKKYVRLRG